MDEARRRRSASAADCAPSPAVCPDARAVAPRIAAGLLAVGLAVLAASCAVRPDPAATPRPPSHPDFLFPAAPAGVGDAGALNGLQRGWRLLQAGDLAGAEREFVAVARRLPAFYPADAALGYVELAHGRPLGGLVRFDRVLERAGDYTPALAGRGDALLASGRAVEALAAFEDCLARGAGDEGMRRRVETVRFRVQRETLLEARAAAEAGNLGPARAAYERAIAASPGSAFLYRELASIERTQDRPDAALGHLQKAADLDPEDAATWIALGDLHESRGDLEEAARAFERAASLDPAGAARAARARQAAEASTFPAEYRAIAGLAAIRRGDLAALVGVRLGPLVSAGPATPGVLVTDAQGHWAAPWIRLVTRASVMEEYPNHTFRPGALVRRTDLARAVSRILDLLASRVTGEAAAWRAARPDIVDMPPGHLGYASAALAVAAGVMTLDEEGAFRPSRAVSGAEAISAIERLEQLTR